MTTYLLFGTEGCHLCEEAEILLHHEGIAFVKTDIMTDEMAWQRYAIRIPVLLNQDNGSELGWPFDTERLRKFIAESTQA